MKCSFNGYPGQYEAKEDTHTVRRDGRVIVIDQISAEVCSICCEGADVYRLARHVYEAAEQNLSSADCGNNYEISTRHSQISCRK